MNYTVRDYQSRVNALKGKEILKIDGMSGPNTKKAISDLMQELNVKDKRDLFHSSGLHRIIWHWSASTYEVTPSVLSHYNDVFDYKGNHYEGAARAEHQANYDWRNGIGVSHTRNCNTGAIGLSVSAMHGARGWPSLEWGNFPLTWEGIDAMLERTAEYSQVFNIPITPWSIMSHAEVEDTLGIPQKNKWDFMVLPGYTKVKNAREVGDELRYRLWSLSNG